MKAINEASALVIYYLDFLLDRMQADPFNQMWIKQIMGKTTYNKLTFPKANSLKAGDIGS